MRDLPFFLRAGHVERFDFEGAGEFHDVTVFVVRRDQGDQYVITGLSVAVPPAGQQRLELQAGDLKQVLSVFRRQGVLSPIGHLFAERVRVLLGECEFTLRLRQLPLKAIGEILLLAQFGLQQFHVAARAKATGGQKQHERPTETLWGRVPHSLVG